jgi:hypothetical protein
MIKGFATCEACNAQVLGTLVYSHQGTDSGAEAEPGMDVKRAVIS